VQVASTSLKTRALSRLIGFAGALAVLEAVLGAYTFRCWVEDIGWGDLNTTGGCVCSLGLSYSMLDQLLLFAAGVWALLKRKDFRLWAHLPLTVVLALALPWFGALLVIGDELRASGKLTAEEFECVSLAMGWFFFQLLTILPVWVFGLRGLQNQAGTRSNERLAI
jgi:hypothetical protein